MPFADVNGQHLYFEDSGGDGAAVIFSHGFLMDHEMFEPQVAALAPEFRCITWDERGFGQTEATAPFTYWDSAADCLALLDHLGISTAVLAGMSQGGFFTLRAALTAPERVRGLVLIDTQAGVEDPEALPLYQGMNDEWVTNGPGNVQDGIAALILGSADHAPWFAKWTRGTEGELGLALRLPRRSRRHHGSPLGDRARPRSSSTAMPTSPSRWTEPRRYATDWATAAGSWSSREPPTPRTSVTPMRSTARSSSSCAPSDREAESGRGLHEWAVRDSNP